MWYASRYIIRHIPSLFCKKGRGTPATPLLGTLPRVHGLGCNVCLQHVDKRRFRARYGGRGVERTLRTRWRVLELVQGRLRQSSQGGHSARRAGRFPSPRPRQRRRLRGALGMSRQLQQPCVRAEIRAVAANLLEQDQQNSSPRALDHTLAGARPPTRQPSRIAVNQRSFPPATACLTVRVRQAHAPPDAIGSALPVMALRLPAPPPPRPPAPGHPRCAHRRPFPGRRRVRPVL